MKIFGRCLPWLHKWSGTYGVRKRIMRRCLICGITR